MVAFARRSPRARLYSLVPRSSQWPSIRTRLSFDFSHAALVSRVFASLWRMSYLSKSKNTSFRLSVARNSLGAGGWPGAVDGATGEGVIEGEGVVDGAAAEGVGAPVGAGAEAAVVAGRFGQPTRKSERASTGTASSSALPRRCAMSPILLGFFVEFVVEFFISTRFWLPKHPITEGAATKRHLSIRRGSGDGLLLGSVREHGEQLVSAGPARLEDEVPAVGRPRGPLVVARPRGQPPQVRSVRAHRPQVKISLPRGEHDRVALRRPARLGVEAGLRETAHVGALRVHHEHVGAAGPLRHEG